MGEVYRATDTNLKRSVAIKVLPDTLAADAERFLVQQLLPQTAAPPLTVILNWPALLKK